MDTLEADLTIVGRTRNLWDRLVEMGQSWILTQRVSRMHDEEGWFCDMLPITTGSDAENCAADLMLSLNPGARGAKSGPRS